MQKNLLITALLILPLLGSAQPLQKREKYDLSKDKVLFTVGYAHLDSEWNWDYPTTINEYIKNTMEENFYLFEKYPDYVFNFTGSRRYQMMKEYYPKLYLKVKEYIDQGRWYVSGSSVDEGEVNISSSESIIRQVLYGNQFFKREFGKESMDYMLPDCFGFPASLPSVLNHSGVLGFSTQKLTWHSAVGVPFNVGVWNGPDGKGVVAALNATSYVGKVISRLDQDTSWNARLNSNIGKYGIPFDFRYYGVGDVGGAPREMDVKNASGSVRNKDGNFKVVLTSSDQMFRDITPEIRKKMPVYSGDLLLIEHSAGSLTSQAYMKRLNRKNEGLASMAEGLASYANICGYASYPFEKLNRSWDLVLGSQFHDILPGTSIPKAYEYAWNDEFIAGNGFAEVVKNSFSAIAQDLNTSGKGRSIVVYNPVASTREDVVTAVLDYETLPADIKVFDYNGKEVPSQILERTDKKLRFIFYAKLPSLGMGVFDVRETSEKANSKPGLSVSENLIENDFYKIEIAKNGDLLSIFDKKLKKELLSQPARLEFLKEKPSEWPAWNMDWKDRQNPPIGFMNEKPVIRVIEKGPVRVSLEISREGRNSQILQVLSLTMGEAGNRIEVFNRADWQSKGVSLKAAFPFTASNENATYNLGLGTIQRANNTFNKFEVPSREWIDVTDHSGAYGVSVLEDCKYGSDKPDDNTIRLTLLYTPESNRSYLPQTSQDWGVHEFKYGIYSHEGDWAKGNTQWQAKFFNQPLIAFETAKHDGKLGKKISFLTLNSQKVGLMAFKKSESDEYFIIRVNELTGKDNKEVNISFPGKIVAAFEVNGQEQKIGETKFFGNALTFDIDKYAVRSFAVKFASSQGDFSGKDQLQLTLPFNQDVFSFDNNRDDGNFSRRSNYPAEMISKEIVSEDIHFKIGNVEDAQMNAVSCKGQEIDIPEGNYSKIYLLAASNSNTTGDFLIDSQKFSRKIQNWMGYIGQFYNRKFAADQFTVTGMDEPYLYTDNIAWFASHCHQAYPSKNNAYQYCYLYKYELPVPRNARKIVLPVNEQIKIFAITLSSKNDNEVKMLGPLQDDFSERGKFQLR